MDFVVDQLADGRRFCSLTVVDIYARGCLAIESEQRLRGEDVVRVLNRIKIHWGVPKMLCCDNGSEFSSQAMDLCAYQNGVRIAFPRPGKPTDNAHLESFNGTFRASIQRFDAILYQVMEFYKCRHQGQLSRNKSAAKRTGAGWDYAKRAALSCDPLGVSGSV